MKISIERRRLCHWLGITAAGLLAPAIARAAPRVDAARVWPSKEYTRLTIETNEALVHRLIGLKSPERLVLDLEGLDEPGELVALAGRVGDLDPYIQSVRVARNRPGVVRIVLDLRSAVSAQVFALKPAGDYAHRLVLDLYPAVPLDPLLALLQEVEERAARAGEPTTRPPVPESVPGSVPESAAKAERRGSNSPSRRRPVTIAIDPGHGGEDPGAIGRGGTYEKHVVLAIGRRLKSMIDGQRGMRSMLTRDDDYFVPLVARVQKARRVNADLFVSIHADAFRTPEARGASVFALSANGASSAAARWLAQKENRSDLIGGVNLGVRDPLLARTLLALSQTATITDSLRVGRFLLEEIAEVNALHKPRVEQAGFAVLKAPDIPSILVETAFISNPDEERKLRSERYQQRMAQSLQDGIRRYFASNPPLARAEVA